MISDIKNEIDESEKLRSEAKVLLDNDSLALRTLMRLNFDKTIKLNLSDEIEYKPAPRHEIYTTLNKETKNYARLVDINRTRERADDIFKNILESLDPREARILDAAKNKNLKMRGLSKKLAKEYFNMVNKTPNVVKIPPIRNSTKICKFFISNNINLRYKSKIIH